MKTIWKYPLPISGQVTVKMPKGAEVLSAKSQHGRDVTLWALVDDSAEEEMRLFVIVGTGHPILPVEGDYRKLKFLATVIVEDGTFVFHVFELV